MGSNPKSLLSPGQHKNCSVCRINKPLSDFGKHPKCEFGVQPRCRPCCAQIARDHRTKDVSKKRADNKIYRDKNKERINEQRKVRDSKPGRKEKLSSIRKEYYTNHPEQIKNSKLKQKYGITLVQYNKMFDEQNGHCAVCQKFEEETDRNGKIIALAVDHCHKTGKVRKLLCSKCNKALGLVKEDFDIALNLARYIQEIKGLI